MTKKWLLFCLATLSAVPLLSFGAVQYTSAQSTNDSSWVYNYGYFTGNIRRAPLMNRMFNQCDGKDPMPSNMNKEQFIERVLEYYNGKCATSEQHRIGASVIINYMLGIKQKNLTTKNIDSWKALVRSGEVKIQSNTVNVYNNTAYDPFIRDVVKYPDLQFNINVLSISFTEPNRKDIKGTINIKSDCGNFVNLSRIPNIWFTTSLNTEDSFQKISISRNESKVLRWTVGAQVVYGITSTSVAVNYAITINFSKEGGDKVATVVKAGSGTYDKETSTVSRPITFDDVGKTFCLQDWNTPRGSNWNGLSYGVFSPEIAGNCWTVVEGLDPTEPPDIDEQSKCRPVKRNIEPASYSAQDNGFVRVEAYTPKYRAKTDVYEDSKLYINKELWGAGDNKVDVTKRHNDGNVHSIILTNETNNIVGLNTAVHTYYRSINQKTRYWIPTTYKTVQDCEEVVVGDRYEEDEYGNLYPVPNIERRCGEPYQAVDVEGHWSPWEDKGEYSGIYRFDSSGGIPGLPGTTDTEDYYYVRDGATYYYTDVVYSNVAYNRVNPYTSPYPGNYPGKITYPKFTNYDGTSREATGSPIGPCFDYALKATLDNFGSRREALEDFSVGGSITSDPFTRDDSRWSGFWNLYQTHSRSKPTKWVISLMKVPVNVIMPNVEGGISPLSPCDYFDSQASSDCSVAKEGVAVYGGGPGGPNGSGGSVSGGFSVPDEYAGTELCYGLSVFPNQSDPLFDEEKNDDGDQWYHAPFNRKNNCVMVVKKPRFQIHGGDLAVGKTPDAGVNVTSGVFGLTSSIYGRTYGSWSEYGILATGGIYSVASGSMYSGGLSGSGNCLISKLSFANTSNSTSCDGTLGNYSFKTPMRDMSTYFPVDSATPSVSGSIDVSTLASGYYVSSSQNLVIGGGNVANSIVLVIPNTDVTITGSITANDSSLNAIGKLGQLVIIARNINIQANVDQVDAWLIAQKGTIRTCSDVGDTDPLTVNICSNQLRINGPVSAKQLILKRTYGSDPGFEKGVPAEVFNLRIDNYLWVYANSLKDNRFQSTYLRNLPPRL